jgi:hypothetical protein
MEPQLNDPVYYDDSEWVMGSSCDFEFDRKSYNSLTCQSCEDKQVSR